MPGTAGTPVNSSRRIHNSILLASVAALLFVAPAAPVGWHPPLNNLCFMAILFSGAFAMESKRKVTILIALVLTGTQWISDLFGFPALVAASRLLMLLFFIRIVFGLISQIARTRIVTGRVIVEAVNGYLLLGIALSIIALLILFLEPGAFTMSSAPAIGRPMLTFNEAVYYTFITYATLGYGDILPTTPLARSFAIAASVAGPMYLTVIIAMLVGKFLGRSQREP